MKKVSYPVLSTVLMLMVLCGALSQAYARLPQDQFGKNWVRTHPFQIYTYSVYQGGTQANGTNIDHMVDLNLTGLMSSFSSDQINASARGLVKHTGCFTGQQGLLWEGNVHPLLVNRINAVSTPDDTDAWFIADEPEPGQVDDITIVKNYLAQNRPNGLAYVNVTTSSLGADIDTLISTANLDAISLDIYPFAGIINFEFTKEYFRSIMLIRQKGLAYKIPYFCCPQGFGYDWRPLLQEYRIASESEMNFNIYSLLTLGYKGLAYYVYNGWSNVYEGADACPYHSGRCPRVDRDINGDGDKTDCYPEIHKYIVDDSGNPTTFYIKARAINAEIWKFCKYLRFLESTGVFFVANTGHEASGYYSAYSDVPLWSASGDGDPYIQSITLGTPVYNKRDALLGFFQDDNGQRYFMIQNMWRDYNATSAERYSTTTIDFGGASLPTPGYVYSLDPITGRPVQVALSQGRYLNIVLGGGMGRLYSYQPITLVGKDTVAPKGSISINNGSAFTSSPSVTVAASASDDSEVDQMRLSNDGVFDTETWEAYNTSRVWTLASGEGSKIVYVQFRDEAGNISATCSDTIAVDTIPPGPAGTPVDGGDYTSLTQVTFSWTAATDSGLGLAGYNCQVGTAPGTSDVFNGSVGNVLSKSVIGVTDTTYYCRVQAVDNAGNVGSWSANSDGITVDNKPPTAPGTPSAGGVYAGASVTFTWIAATDTGSSIDRYRCRIGTTPGGGDVYNGEVGNVLSKTITGNDGVTYYCMVRAIDRAANTGPYSPNSAGITVDQTPPVPGTVTSPGSASAVPLTVTYSGASDSISGLKLVQLRYRKGSSGTWAAASCPAQTGASGAFSFTDVSGDGTYYFGLVAEDNVGNSSAAPTGSGQCNTVYSSPNTITGSLVLQDYAGDITNVPIRVELRKHGGGTTTRTINLDANGNFTLTGVEAGTYDLAFKASHWLSKVYPNVVVGGL